jgi:rRNA maturation endonuclease Nob1
MSNPAAVSAYEEVTDAAQKHGSESEPDHEVGDLQDALRVALNLLTPEQVEMFKQDYSVQQVLEWSSA